MLASLLDDRTRPDFRETFGALLSRASQLDVALTHLRLSTIDLTDHELKRVTRVRLLLAHVSAIALDGEAHAVLHRPDRADNLRRLASLLMRGRVEVRSAPLAGWSPDFSVFGDANDPHAVLVGPHRFDTSDLGGPSLASVHGPEEAARVLARFDELWGRAHDIRAAIAGILRRAERGIGAPPLDGPRAAGRSGSIVTTGSYDV